MKKLILSFLFLPSLVMGDHCDDGACPALEHFKDTGDEVAKDLLPYVGVGLVLMVAQSNSDQSSLSYINFDTQNRPNGIKIYDNKKYISIMPSQKIMKISSIHQFIMMIYSKQIMASTF